MGGDEIKVELNDRKNGTYLAEYTVDKLCGKLTLSVFLRGVHIKNSPFSVLVEPLNLIQLSRPSGGDAWKEERRGVARFLVPVIVCLQSFVAGLLRLF